MLKPLLQDVDVSTGLAEEKKKECAYQEHQPASYAYKIVLIDLSFNHELKIYKGIDAAEHFIDYLQAKSEKIYNGIKEKKKCPFLQVRNKNDSTWQHIVTCKEPFNEGEKKVRDHCHILHIRSIFYGYLLDALCREITV